MIPNLYCNHCFTDIAILLQAYFANSLSSCHISISNINLSVHYAKFCINEKYDIQQDELDELLTKLFGYSFNQVNVYVIQVVNILMLITAAWLADRDNFLFHPAHVGNRSHINEALTHPMSMFTISDVTIKTYSPVARLAHPRDKLIILSWL